MHKSKPYALYFLLLILIITSFFRLYNITQVPPGLYPDEAMNGNNALEAIAAGQWKVFYPENNGREGLFINIQALSIMVFGNEPWALRVVSALFGIFTVLGVYFLTKELFKGTHIQNKFLNWPQKIDFNEKVALLSSFFMAASFWHINFSRIGFRAIMAPFFLTWALYFLLKSFNTITKNIRHSRNKFGTSSDLGEGSQDSSSANWRTKNDRQSFKWVGWATLSGLMWGLGFYSYIAFRQMPLLVLVILIYFWVKYKDWQIHKRFLLLTFYILLLTFLVFAPLGIHFIKNPQDFMGRTSQVSVLSSPTPLKDLTINAGKTLAMFNFKGDGNWRHNYAGSPQLFWPAGILLVIGFMVAVYELFRHRHKEALEKNRRVSFDKNLLFSDRQERPFKNPDADKSIRLPVLMIFAWLILASLPVVISNEGIPHALRAIIMIPPIFMLVGLGGIWVYEKLFLKVRLKKFLFTTCYLLFAILIIQVYFTYFIQWGKNENVFGAFSQNYVDIGRELNSLPIEMPKYVIVKAGGTDVRSIPMPTQTVMYITDTFTPKNQAIKNIHYVLPDRINEIPEGSYTVAIE